MVVLGLLSCCARGCMHALLVVKATMEEGECDSYSSPGRRRGGTGGQGSEDAGWVV